MIINTNLSTTVEKIRSFLLMGQINKFEAAASLLTLINNSNNDEIRINSIELLGKISHVSKQIFKSLENCLVSDENPLIRAAAASELLHNYQEECYPSLEWTIKHENSIKVIKILLTLFKELENKKTVKLNEKLKHRLSTKYGVVPEEVEFLLDLELEVNFFNINYLKMYSTNAIKGVISDRDSNYMMCAIINGHIKALNLSKWGLNRIPDSIGLLKKLEHLILKKNYIKTIPESLSNLSCLKTLDLSKCNVDSLPYSLTKLDKLKTFSIAHNYNIKLVPPSIISISKRYYGRKYTQEGVCPKESHVLGVLEIISGVTLSKISKNDLTLYKDCASHYKINENGNIVGIYLFHSKNPYLNFIPEVIIELNHLEELELPNNKIKSIPYSLGKLDSLKRLNLRNNEIPFIPGSLINLTKLNCLKLAGNKIREIPDWIKIKLDIRKCSYDMNGFRRYFFGIPIKEIIRRFSPNLNERENYLKRFLSNN
ncbi:MAG: hypothetical protein EU539_11105 [Promethearchaeota archaeon]|nr:MAG: hypothetical protein EU539_11105 [Candidatus Lokiarchaeota archaeon]